MSHAASFTAPPAAAITCAQELARGRGHVKAREVRVAERAVHRLIRRNRMRLENRAGGGKDLHERSRPAFSPSGASDDIAFAVHAHASMRGDRARSMQDGERSERVVRDDGIGAQLAPSARRVPVPRRTRWTRPATARPRAARPCRKSCGGGPRPCGTNRAQDAARKHVRAQEDLRAGPRSSLCDR